jgi:aerobic carbon-monoxide dehydrogenase medium subunit
MQVPAYVEYEKATSLAHALALLARFGPEARILAGGHSLIPMMKLRLAQPETLIDINALTELSYLTVTGHELRIGAMTRHAQLLDSAEAARHFAILHDAEQVIADPVVRNWGTVGGSLCQADPSEDLSAAFAALKATMVIARPEGTRTVPARDFHTGPYETVVAPGEILTEIRVPIRPGGGSAYEKVGRRAGDWPVGAAGSALWLEGGEWKGSGLQGGGLEGGRLEGGRLEGGRWQGGGLDGGTIADAGIGLTAVGAPHFSAAEAEEFLRGVPATEESFARAGDLAAASCRPVSDQRGPADYKRHLARELTIRSLRRAWQRAEHGPGQGAGQRAGQQSAG